MSLQKCSCINEGEKRLLIWAVASKIIEIEVEIERMQRAPIIPEEKKKRDEWIQEAFKPQIGSLRKLVDSLEETPNCLMES